MLLFVYGSMLRQGYNHVRLYEQRAIFIGEFETVDRFAMYRRSRDGVPMAVRDPNDGYPIFGELYAIEDSMIDHIDHCEGHPILYERQNITLYNFNENNNLDVHMYVYVLERVPLGEPINPDWEGLLRYSPIKPSCSDMVAGV